MVVSRGLDESDEDAGLSDHTGSRSRPIRYLCGGQLTNCVPQPGTDRKLDAQGDKIMPRLVYRRHGRRESIVAVHSVDTAAGGGGVRWYEFRLDHQRAPAALSTGHICARRFLSMDGQSGNGSSSATSGSAIRLAGAPHFPGQRFAGRLAGDPLGQLTLAKRFLSKGRLRRRRTMRWEDYSQTAIDPVDDCTIWYVGDYLKKDAATYSTRIGAFRMGACGR